MDADGLSRMIHSGYRAVFALAGGGSGALHTLLSTPGASRFISEAAIPYSSEALSRFLGEKSAQAVSSETARGLAEAAFRRASEYSTGEGDPPLAVSCTAALQTDRTRKGDDRAFISIRSETSETVFSIFFSKASRREQEERLSEWILNLTAQVCGAEGFLILPGSFYPFHSGHAGLLAAAEKLTGRAGFFELSCLNVDKPEADECECLLRAAAIRDIPVALTAAPRFVQKAALFPGAVFVLGYDTAERLIQGASSGEWEQFQAAGIRFLVAGRFLGGRFQTPEELAFPPGFEGLFEAIPESVFRDDISSTALREKRHGHSE